MRTIGTVLRFVPYLGSAVAVTLLLGVPAAGQSRSDEEYERLIERLEFGMSAVKELGEADVLEQLARIADRVREERVAARRGGAVERESNDEIREVRRRLRVMRSAVEIFLEAGKKDAAELVESAMHARELAIEGRRDAEAARIREAAPDRNQLSVVLARAAELQAEWGHPDQAEELGQLSKTFAEQWARRQRAQREGRTEERGAELERLDSLARRVKILDLARRAHAEAGNEKAAGSLAAAVRYGELVLKGVGDEDLSAAAREVPSLRGLADLLQSASIAYSEWGNAERAAACAKLSVYYWNRADELGQPTDEAEPVPLPEPVRDRPLPGNLQERSARLDIIRLGIVAYRRFDRAEQAGYLERFLRFGELQEAGASGEVLSEAARGLTMGGAIEAMNGAAELYRELGAPDRADACRALAEFYGGGDGGGEARREGEEPADLEPEPLPDRLSLDERSNRLEILQVVLDAHAEAGHEEAVGFLQRALEVGRLQESGASQEAILQAAEGFSLERLTDLVQRAANLYAEWDKPDRAQLCADLADYYVGREAGRVDATAAPEEPAPKGREDADRERAEARLAELTQRLSDLEAELERLEAAIRDRERR